MIVVDNVPEGEHTPDRCQGAWWVLLQVGLRNHMLVRRPHAPQVLRLKRTKPFLCPHHQQVRPPLCPMDHVLLERAAHDKQTVLRAIDWDHKAVLA